MACKLSNFIDLLTRKTGLNFVKINKVLLYAQEFFCVFFMNYCLISQRLNEFIVEKLGVQKASSKTIIIFLVGFF